MLSVLLVYGSTDWGIYYVEALMLVIFIYYSIMILILPLMAQFKFIYQLHKFPYALSNTLEAELEAMRKVF